MNRSVTRWSVMAALGIAVVLALAPSASAAEDRRGEIGVLLGLERADADLVNRDGDTSDGPVLGVRGAWRLSDATMWFADVTFGRHDWRASDEATDILDLRTGLEVLFPGPGENLEWFLAGAVGYTQINLPNPIEDVDRPLGSVGVGLRKPTEYGIARGELRWESTLNHNGLDRHLISNWQLLFGWSWGFGGPPGDADGDGVIDRKDKCPDTPQGATVDVKGCPMDTDGDGVYDGIDKCPDTPKGWPVDASGCPKDTDGDGVADGKDACPDTPRGAKVDARGCPTDGDGDGVYDGIDKCPNTPKGVKVDATGCPIDSDGDGVTDDLDKCPDTPRGTKVDATGCPIPEVKKAEPLFEAGKKTLVLEGVNFAYDSADLLPESKIVLDKVATSLKDWPEVRVEVGGHTDSRGADAYNLKLSQRRADAVRGYLEAQGIDGSRLKSKGYGETKPIADNKTDAGRAKNRRVELTRLD